MSLKLTISCIWGGHLYFVVNNAVLSRCCGHPIPGFLLCDGVQKGWGAEGVAADQEIPADSGWGSTICMVGGRSVMCVIIERHLLPQ
jgi:hypothetical protein